MTIVVVCISQRKWRSITRGEFGFNTGVSVSIIEFDSFLQDEWFGTEIQF